MGGVDVLVRRSGLAILANMGYKFVDGRDCYLWPIRFCMVMVGSSWPLFVSELYPTPIQLLPSGLAF